MFYIILTLCGTFLVIKAYQNFVCNLHNQSTDLILLVAREFVLIMDFNTDSELLWVIDCSMVFITVRDQHVHLKFSTAVYFYQAVMRNENFAGPCASFSSCLSLLLLPSSIMLESIRFYSIFLRMIILVCLGFSSY